MKYKVRALMLMLLMCWASQSSAQPTRATKTSTYVKKLTYGVCDLQSSITDERSYKVALKGGRGLSPVDNVALNILPKGYYTETIAKAGAADDRNYTVPDWMDSLIIKRINEPKHGVMAKADVPDYYKGFTGSLYVPNKDFIGKDRVDFLVTGKDLDGKPFEMTVKYYINVVSDTQLQKAIKNDKTYQQAMKMYCDSSTTTWRISK
jgi:hypothetical protein